MKLYLAGWRIRYDNKINKPATILNFGEILTSDIDVLVSYRDRDPRLSGVMKTIVGSIRSNVEYSSRWLEGWRKEEHQMVFKMSDRIMSILEGKEKGKEEEKIDDVIMKCERLTIRSKKRSPSDRCGDDRMDDVNMPCKRMRCDEM